MGREALVRVRIDGEAGETGQVKALLESRELILRGPIRRRYPTAALREVRVQDSWLAFECGGETVALDLGARAAAYWATAISRPPPTLRAKLGLDKGAAALLVGDCDDADLAEALAGARTDEPADAGMVIARIDGPDDLAAARAAAGSLPLWAVYPKGRSVTFGDTAIRTELRAAGWRDTKSCAVSDRLTATRYVPG